VPEAHIDMIRFWTGYWRLNREVLLDGALHPARPAALYPIVRAQGDGRMIVGLYEDVVVSLADASDGAIDVINAKPSTAVVLRLQRGLGERTVATYTTVGTPVERARRPLAAGVHEFTVPPSGLLRIERR
jgi:alpha-galactosidase